MARSVGASEFFGELRRSPLRGVPRSRRRWGGVDPTYAQVYWSCKGASINPATGKLVDKRAVYVVFKERPYDGEADPDNTWTCRPCLSRTAITEDVGGQAARTDSVGVGSSPHQCLVLQPYGASQQPGSLFEKTLHETAVSWIRCGLTWTLPPRLWEGAPTELARRLGAVAEDINMCHSVEGLCRELPPACLGLARYGW